MHFSLAEISRQHCKDRVALFARVPAYVSQHYKGMTLWAMVDAYEKHNAQSANRHDEAAKHLANLRRMLTRHCGLSRIERVDSGPGLKVEGKGWWN